MKIVVSMGGPNSIPVSAGDHSIPAPRLSILHFMLWMLCSAVYLAAMRVMYSLQAVPNDYAVIQRNSGAIHGVIIGAVLMGAIVLGYTCYRTDAPLIRHPGHWLLLVSASVTSASLPLSFLFLLSGMTSPAIFLLVYSAILTAQAVAYILALRHSLRIGWRSLFGALALLSAIQSLTYLAMGFELYLGAWSVLMSIPTWGQFLVGGWIVVVSTLDLMDGQRRDWLHWTGIATYVAYTGMNLFWMLTARIV